MPEPRPDYAQNRIDYALARQRHAREAPDCSGCHYCWTQAEIERLLAERLRLERLLHGEAPF